MARLARVVVPDAAHHVTQRGNRRQEILFSDDDYAAYRDLIAAEYSGDTILIGRSVGEPGHFVWLGSLTS